MSSVVGAPSEAEAAGPTGSIVGIGNKCLTNQGGGTTNGNPVVLSSCTGAPHQQWNLPGDGSIRTQGNRCLAAKGAGTTSMTPVWTWTCDGGPAQVWSVRSNGTVVNTHSGLCLADKGGVTVDGNPIWVYTCDAGPAQLWRVPSSVDPSGEPLPVGNLPGWRQVFTDNFATDVPLGSFPRAVSNRWTAYSGFEDTWGNGWYDPGRVVSVSGGVMNMNLHTENGRHLVSAPLPIIPGHGSAYNGQAYGRYAVRFRADPVPGYKTAWLLWPDGPDGGDWNDGEIDFPEGNLNGSIHAFMHYRGNPRQQGAYPTNVSYNGWHTAVIEWTPTNVRFILDGTTIGNFTNASVIPNSPMHWVLQTETTESGPTDTAAGRVQIDWVAIWARTP